MVQIQWDEKYSVHVDKFDHQHKYLILTLNELIRAVVEKKDHDVLGKLLSHLVRYSEVHFASEEEAMEKYSYPRWEEHRQEHQAFIQKVETFQQSFLSGKETLGPAVLKFLYEWLLFHIQGSDAEYSQYFNEHGLL